MADTYTGEFYCVKCKTKREATGAVSVNDKGTRVAKAQCPECSTNLTRFLPKAWPRGPPPPAPPAAAASGGWWCCPVVVRLLSEGPRPSLA